MNAIVATGAALLAEVGGTAGGAVASAVCREPGIGVEAVIAAVSHHLEGADPADAVRRLKQFVEEFSESYEGLMCGGGRVGLVGVTQVVPFQSARRRLA